jgi:hypothetical protein
MMVAHALPIKYHKLKFFIPPSNVRTFRGRTELPVDISFFPWFTINLKHVSFRLSIIFIALKFVYIRFYSLN